LLNSNISSTCAHNMASFGPITAEIGLPVWGSQANCNGFRVLPSSFVTSATSLTRGQPNFARCLAVFCAGILYIHFRGLLPGQNFASTSKSCVLLYCTALQQRASAKLCSVVQGMDLWNFRRGRHLYSAGQPSHWASAYILLLSESGNVAHKQQTRNIQKDRQCR